jgi:hypothetical protein
MNVAVVSSDPLFRAAVAGIVGATGHAEVGAESGRALTVVDGALGAEAVRAAVATGDPLTTVVFFPAAEQALMAAARSLGVMHVHPRRDVAVELPRIIALSAAD